MQINEIVDIIRAGIFVLKIEPKEDYLTFLKNLEYTETNDDSKTFVTKSYQVLKQNTNLNNQIKDAIKKVLKDCYQFKNYNSFKIFTSWGTKTPKNGSSNIHSHGNSWLSGVYYPEDSSPIRFYNDCMSIFSDLIIKENKYNSSEYILNPTKNTLILFPSSVRHEILLNNKETRYSLAFNILPKGVFGSYDTNLGEY